MLRWTPVVRFTGRLKLLARDTMRYGVMSALRPAFSPDVIVETLLGPLVVDCDLVVGPLSEIKR